MSSAYLVLDDASFTLENLVHLQTSFASGASVVGRSFIFLLTEPDPVLREKEKLHLGLI